MSSRLCAYEVDSHWRIVAANDELCRALLCTAAGLVGRDVRDLIRADWQSDFRSYVAKALVGAGDDTLTLPIVTRIDAAWFTHTLEPIRVDGEVSGYRAWLVPHQTSSSHPRHQIRDTETHLVWNFEPTERAG